MAVNEEQQKFLEQLARLIPRLFDAIRAGNIKSEFIIGVRRIGQRHVRLKLVAEVVDPGVNPLKTHGTLASAVAGTIVPVSIASHAELVPGTSIEPKTPGVTSGLKPDDESSDQTQLTPTTERNVRRHSSQD